MAETDQEILDELKEFASEEGEEEEEDDEEESETEDSAELDRLRSELESYKTDAQAARNFRANPTQSLNELAAQLGYKLSPQAPAQTSGGTPSTYDGAVREAVEEAFEGSDDLGFLKPQFQQAISKALEKVIKPIEDMSAREKTEQRRAVVDSVEARMDQDYPGWRQHNDDMQAVGDFLRQALNGGNLNHPKYGSIYQMAYQIVTGDGRATANAAKRLSRTSNNATRTGGSSSTKPNVAKKIKDTTNRDSQVEIALDAALSELGL